MRLKNFFLPFAFCAFALMSCEKSPEGPAQKTIKERYKHANNYTKIFTPSMIRAGLKTAKIDSTSDFSKNIDYVMTFSFPNQERAYNLETDSLLQIALEKAGVVPFGTYKTRESNFALYVKNDGAEVQNLVITSDDPKAYNIYEFVGAMPMKELMEFTQNNAAGAQQLMNFNLPFDARNPVKNP